MTRKTRRLAAVASAAMVATWMAGGGVPAVQAATYASTCSFSSSSVTLSTAGETQTLTYTVSPSPSWYYFAEFVDNVVEDETPRNDSGDSISLDYDSVIAAHGPAPVTVEYRVYELNGTGSSLESSTVLCSATVTFDIDTSDPGGGGGTDPSDPGGGGGTDPSDPGGGGGTDPSDPSDPSDPTDPGDGGSGGEEGTDSGSGELPATGATPAALVAMSVLLMLAGLVVRHRASGGRGLARAALATAAGTAILVSATGADAASETACSFTPDYVILGPGDSQTFAQTGTVGAWTHFQKVIDGSPVTSGGPGQKLNNDPFTLTYDDALMDSRTPTGLFLTYEYYPVDDNSNIKIPDSSPLCSFTIGFDHNGDGVADGGPWGDDDTGGEESRNDLPRTGWSLSAALLLAGTALLGGDVLRRRSSRS